MKHLLYLIAFFLFFSGAVQGAECRISDGKAVLSNDLLLVEIAPDQGGRVIRILHKKSGKELTDGERLPGGYGLFSEGIRTPYTSQLDKSYQVRKYDLVRRESSSLALAVLRSPAGLPFTVEKHYSLRDGEERLSVEYIVSNPGKSDRTGALYINNAFRFSGEKSYTLNFPRGYRNHSWEKGSVLKESVFHYQPGVTPAADYFIHDPERDYGMISGKDIAVILESDYRFLDTFYTYLSPRSNAYAISDIFSMPFQLPPLAEGVKNAELFASQHDPLAAYRYRFKLSLRITDPRKVRYTQYKGIAREKKSDSFAPRLSGQKLFTDFHTPAVIREKSVLYPYPVVFLSIVHGNPEVTELLRRLNLLHGDVVDTSNTTAWKGSGSWGWQVPSPGKILRKALQKKPRIMVVTGHHEKPMEKDLVQEICRLVEKEGMTFIYVGDKNHFPSVIPTRGGRVLEESFFDDRMKEHIASPRTVKVYSRGKGKVIHVQFRMHPVTAWMRESRVLIPYRKGGLPSPVWEYYYSFYGKLFRYAAGIRSVAKITKVETHSTSLRLRIRSEEARKDVSLKLLLEDPSGKRSESILWKGDLKQGENVLEKVIPGNRTLLSGEYLCFLSLEEDQKTLDWYDTVFRHEGKAQILALETDKDVYGKNEAVRGTLLAKGPGTLLLYLRESATGRVISRLKMKAVPGKKIPFALKKVFASREKHFTLECRIFHKGVLHAERKKELLMRPERKREEKITPLLWGSHFMSWREKLYNKDFAQMGFKIFKSPIAYQKGIEDYRWEGYDVLQYGMEYAPLGIEHIRAKQWKDMPYTRRTPCLLSPSYRKNLRKKAEVVAGKMNQLLSDYCFVSDEISLGYSFAQAHDYCFAPDCLKAFRAWMKKKYKGDLKALNRDWQRNYKSFSEILPDTVEQAQKRGNFVSNQEHRLFMMNHLTDSCKIIADTISQISGAQTGMSGMPLTTVYQGFDVLDTMPILKCSTLYVQPFTIDLMRSLMGKDHISGAYTDYRVRYQVWEQLIGGLRTPSIWWYGHLIRRGDGRASEEGILLSRMFRSIRDSGSSFILGHGKRTSSPVTLVWSTPSLTAASLVRENGKLFLHDPYNRNMNSISQLIRDLGMDMPNVIPDRDLIKVTARTHPVLVLPGTIRLSENQVKALCCYVREGGVLIADLLPGVFNEFGVKRVANPLMKLFGIRSLGKRIQQRSSITLDNLIPRHMLWGNVLELEKGVHAFRNIQEVFHPIRAGSMTVSGASKLLSKALVVNSVGKGKALYMNFAFSRYDTLCGLNDQDADKVRSVMREVFTCAGLNMGKAHALMPSASFAEYTLGNIPYWFLSRKNSSSAGNFTLKAPRSVHMYEMLSGRYLGYKKEYSSILPGSGVTVVGCFPEKLGVFRGKGSFDSRFVRLELSRPKQNPFREILRMRIFHNGKEILPLAESRLMKDSLQWELDLGLAVQSGKWHVEVSAPADASVFRYDFEVR